MTRVLEFMSSDEHGSQVASLPLRGLFFFFFANHNNLTQPLCRRAKQKSESCASAPPPPRWTFKPGRFSVLFSHFHNKPFVIYLILFDDDSVPVVRLIPCNAGPIWGSDLVLKAGQSWVSMQALTGAGGCNTPSQRLLGVTPLMQTWLKLPIILHRMTQHGSKT